MLLFFMNEKNSTVVNRLILKGPGGWANERPPGDYMWVDIGPMKQPHVVTGGFFHWPNVDPHVVTGGVLPERTPVGTGMQRKNPGEDKHPTRNRERERGVFVLQYFTVFCSIFAVFLDPWGVF